MDDAAAFARLIAALRPWQDQLVVVGGWAHWLHRLHRTAHALDYQPLRTLDADIAFAPTRSLTGDIGAALRAAGFHPEITGDHVPPLTQYRLGEEAQGFFVEFLVPLQGSGHKRDGTPDATIAKAGVTAQKLRYIELLLTQPWTVTLNASVGASVTTPSSVLIANPVSFIAHKLLISGLRPPRKRAQDVLYIHDTLDLFGAELDALSALWRETIRDTLPSKLAAQVEASHREQFTVVTDVVREAARIPQDRTLSPERIRLAIAHGLSAIFATR